MAQIGATQPWDEALWLIPRLASLLGQHTCQPTHVPPSPVHGPSTSLPELPSPHPLSHLSNLPCTGRLG